MPLRHIITTLCMLGCFNSYSQSNFKLFFEKAYLHTDRDYYAAGEDIWLKAYLVNAQTGIRINTSANLYVELISPESKVIDREMLHLVNGLAGGDFHLPDNAGAGNYRLRAYTNWMKNFGDMFFFEKKIEVTADETIKIKTTRSVPVVASAITPTASVGTNHIHFFPEGGAMVAGLPIRMAFKANDAVGRSMTIKGKIVTAAGDSVAAFVSTHAGMGSFIFTPLPGIVYTATGKYAGKEIFNEPLPAALQQGYTLSVNDAGNFYAVRVQADNATIAALGGRAILAGAKATGKTCFADSLHFTGNQATLQIPKDSLKPGINAITVYDEAGRPHAERLVFMPSAKPATVMVQTNQPAYGTRQPTTVTIAVTDAQNQPVQAHFSLVATDAGLIQPGNSNIVSYLLLQSEIRGEIENPMQYFDGANSRRAEQLDLLLQTQGWREFLWRRLRDTSVVIKYLPEPGITLSGRVRQTFANKGISDMNITLYAEKSSGDKIFFTQTDSSGRYFLDGLPLVGLQTVKLTARNKKAKKQGIILLDSVLAKPWPVKMFDNVIYDTSDVLQNFRRVAVQRKNQMQAQEKFDKGDLGNVTVRADAIKKERLEEGGMKFGHADSVFTITGADKEFETLGHFIVQRYPGAYTDANSDGFFFYADGKKTLPRWIVDGREDKFSTGTPFNIDEETGNNEGSFERVDYYNISIEKVKKIYVQPVVSRTGSLIYVIHLSLRPDAFEVDDLSQIITDINGYYEARKYYVPDFAATTGNTTKADLRSTIYWAPDVKTDANGKATLTFNNSDTKTTVLVNVEGITDKGEPVAATVKYIVK